MPQPGALIGFGVVIAAVLLTWGIIALVDYVDDGDSGDGGSSGGSSTPDSSDIQEQLNDASPGDIIYLPEGEHYFSLTTAVDGEEDNPITIRREIGASREDVILKGDDDNGRVLEILHSYYIIEEFTIDGEIDPGDDYREHLLFVEGSEDIDSVNGVESSVTGVVIQNMIIRNAGQECVRLRYYVTASIVQDNIIENCGIEDFQLGSSGSNGEGIYIGTASGQWDENDMPDICQGNWIRGNDIDTQGSEGIEVKEGSISNIIEENNIYGQMDANSGGIGLRGDDNIVRYNLVADAVGACVRIGGYEVDDTQYGTGNEVYSNDFVRCEYAAVKVNELPQIICNNDVTDPTNPDGEYLVVRGDTASEFPDITESCPSLTTVIPPAIPSNGVDDDITTITDQDVDDDVVIEDDDATGDYSYVGCFQDSENNRVLDFVLESEGGMTVEICVAACVVEGEEYAGLQAGSECWCGSPTDYDPYGAGICTAACAGDDSIVCGGSYLFSLYLIIGDGGFPVVTDGADDDATPSPTPAPVQSGTDDNDDQGDDDGGTGGDEESDVITTTDVEGGNSAEGDYIGCYRDSDSDPILPDFQYEDEEDLTPTQCINTCADHSASYAGMQNGNKCWCGSSTDYDRYGSGICNLSCVGDASYTCGGDVSSDVWEVN